MPTFESSIDRRRFLKGAALATAGLAATGLPLGAASGVRSDARPGTNASALTARGEPRPRTPDEALALLMAGNGRFVAGEATGLHRDAARIRELASGQQPFAAVLSCADSRVPPELLFDQGFGDIFTVRVAGNVSGTEEVASLEYAAGVLGSSLVMVLGHTSCGAVHAAMQGGAVPGRISALYSHITPAIRAAGGDIDAAVTANVRYQADTIRSSSPVMREAIDAGTLRVVGAVYDLASGRVSLVDEG